MLKNSLYLNFESKRFTWARYITATLRSKSIHKQIDKPSFVYTATENQHQIELKQSITYAKRIQDALIPSLSLLRENYPKSFVINYPKAVVSGDFYWHHRLGELDLIIVADCTGHGVPGAFMSVLGIALLNQLVLEEGMTNPESLIYQLNLQLRKAFGVKSDENVFLPDGMDLGLVVIHKSRFEMTFIGALRPLYLIRNHSLISYQPNRFSLGGGKLDQQSFTVHQARLRKGDRLFLFSDGYADQFGGTNNKKLRTVGFKNLLVNSSYGDMNNQQMQLKKFFQKWKGIQEQTDDVLVLGIEI